MSNPLVDHAYKNVWCDPAMDFEYIFEPARIGTSQGFIGTATVMLRTVQMPTAADRYFLYQIGANYPQQLGLKMTSGWWTLAKVMRESLTYIQVYTADGVLFPLAECYMLFTRDRTLVLAVKAQPNLPSPMSNTLYFRFYTNAYYNSAQAQSQVNSVVSAFYRHDNVNDALIFQNQFLVTSKKSGYTTLTLNGRYVDSFIAQSLTKGDILEYVYDSSVKRVIDFPISDLSTFTSRKDAMSKYLLHYSGAQTGGLMIDYRDDCDLWLIKKAGSTWDGVMFNKNQDNCMRMVTHRDYSIATPYVDSYLQAQPTWDNADELTLRLVIRHAGFDRPLVPEAHQIHELYKLPDQLILNAMLGIDSTVDAWKAADLEDSSYPDIMDAYYGKVTLPMVESAYGYNGASLVLANSPLIPDDEGKVTLGAAVQAQSTVYEYDADGLLLGWYPHVSGAEYRPVYEGAALLEPLVGPGSKVLPLYYGQNNIPIQAGYSYRYYITTITNGVVDTNGWIDVTKDPTKWSIVNGNLVWLVDTAKYQTAVKSDASHLVYTSTLSSSAGYLEFTIQAAVSYPNGIVTEPLPIQPGQLDLFLNQHALIKDVDYYVNWPKIVVVNKEYLAEGDEQAITVRAFGFCEDTMVMPDVAESGFAAWDELSYNGKFNIRDNHVQRVIVAGRTFAKSQLVFAEDQSTASTAPFANGSPYQIQDIVVPLRSFVDQDTYDLRGPALAVDQAVSNYLTLKLPQTDPSTPSVIPDKYSVYSPFVSAIIYAMINGLISMDDFKGQYSDRILKQRLANYEYLLSYDPARLGVDSNYVAVHPTPLYTVIELSIYQWKFIQNAIRVYLNGAVDLSKFVTITGNWIDGS